MAVQSHWFQVGPIVPWAEAGVGAVATQSFVKVDYGPRGLALMRGGASAEEALQKLLAQDEQRDVRQEGSAQLVDDEHLPPEELAHPVPAVVGLERFERRKVLPRGERAQ